MTSRLVRGTSRQVHRTCRPVHRTSRPVPMTSRLVRGTSRQVPRTCRPAHRTSRPVPRTSRRTVLSMHTHMHCTLRSNINQAAKSGKIMHAHTLGIRKAVARPGIRV